MCKVILPAIIKCGIRDLSRPLFLLKKKSCVSNLGKKKKVVSDDGMWMCHWPSVRFLLRSTKCQIPWPCVSTKSVKH
jgi:hypothetical protein